MNPNQILARVDSIGIFRVSFGLTQRIINAGGNHVVLPGSDLRLMEGPQ